VDLQNGIIPTYVDESCIGFLKRAGGPDCGPGAGGDACGDRIATFILHLAAPTKGGRTVFPSKKFNDPAFNSDSGNNDDDPNDVYYCHEDTLGVNPSPGDATLFWDYVPGNTIPRGSYTNGTAEPNGMPVPEALHSGCPVLEGEKWIATRWIRSAKFV
jgi:prolyl 4-hydroxylase